MLKSIKFGITCRSGEAFLKILYVMKVTEIVSTNYTLEIPILKPQTNVKSPNFQFQQSMSHDYK